MDSGSFGGSIIPGIPEHTIFLSGERSYLADGYPPGISIDFPTINKSTEYREENESNSWRFTGRTTHQLSSLKVNLGANYNEREYRQYILKYQKNNARGNPLLTDENLSLSGRLSQTISNNSF